MVSVMAKVKHKVKPDGSFEVKSSIDIFVFRFMAIGPFWPRYSKYPIGSWNFKVKVMTKFKPDGPIWGLEFNRYVCFTFRDNQRMFGSSGGAGAGAGVRTGPKTLSHPRYSGVT